MISTPLTNTVQRPADFLLCHLLDSFSSFPSPTSLGTKEEGASAAVSIIADLTVRGRTSSNGTWYVIEGDENETKTIVLIHGLGSCGCVWYVYAKKIAQVTGYRVVIPDLYGCGFSESPGLTQKRFKYDDTCYIVQLSSLFEELGMSKENPVILVGHSMGGAVVTTFTVKHPSLVKGCVLMAPAGFEIPLPTAALVSKLPGIGELINVMGLGKKELNKTLPDGFANPLSGDRELEIALVQGLDSHHTADNKGKLKAVLSNLRHFPLTTLAKRGDYDSLNNQTMPILVIWGLNDRVSTKAALRECRSKLNRAEVAELPGVGHCLQWDGSTALPPLLKFLKQFL